MTLIEQILSIFFKTLSKKELLRMINLLENIAGSKTPYEDRVKKYWDNISKLDKLQNIYPPAIPSVGDLENYKKFLLPGGTTKSALLLGSTPGLRNLLAELNVKNCVVADFSFKMIARNLELAEKTNLDQEIWLKSNWSIMPLQHFYFDYILGDLVCSQILPHEQDRFFHKISELLNQQGKFVLRNHSANTGLKNIPIAKVMQEALETLSPNSNTAHFFALTYRLRDKFRNEKSQTTSPQEIIDALANHAPRNENERDLIKKLIKVFSNRAENNFEYIVQIKNEFEATISKNFEIAETLYANDYPDAENFPLYCLKRPA